MSALQRIIEWIVGVQSILFGAWLALKLWDLFFEKLLNTIGVGSAFKDFICGPYFRKKRLEAEAKEAGE